MKKDVNKVIENLKNKLKEKREMYTEMAYIKAINQVAEGIIPYKKNEFANLPYVGTEF